MKNLVVLMSGRGSNMRAIHAACHAGRWPAAIGAVVCNRPQAPGLVLAAELGLPTVVVDHGGFASRDAFDRALGDAIEPLAPDLIVMAGFMRILGAAFVERFAGRMINIHPSLLPLFPGLATHRAALAAGVAVHGATVHLVTPALDAGPIIAQAVVPVRLDDSEQSLADRVLVAEHALYPRVIEWIVSGRLALQRSALRWQGEPPQRLITPGQVAAGFEVAV